MQEAFILRCHCCGKAQFYGRRIFKRSQLDTAHRSGQHGLENGVGQAFRRLEIDEQRQALEGLMERRGHRHRGKDRRG